MRNLILNSTILCGLMMAAFPALAQDTTPVDTEKNIVLEGKNNAEFGTVNIKETPHGLLLTVEVQGVSEGWHGFHVHEIGDCSDNETFKTAGGHAFAFPDQPHGLLDEESPHIGDLPNIWANETGHGKAQIYTVLHYEGLNDLDGSAFVLHASADDYTTDPSGEAGGRVACGVIFPAKVESQQD